jgi:hypothetical protein
MSQSITDFGEVIFDFVFQEPQVRHARLKLQVPSMLSLRADGLLVGAFFNIYPGMMTWLCKTTPCWR